MYTKLKNNWDILLFAAIHAVLFIYLLTGVQYFMLDLPTSMYINECYGLWGIFYMPQATGRYWPIDPFINSLVTECFGNDVIWQWIVHYFIFVVLTILIWRNSYLCIKNRKKAFASVIFCICVTPMAENVFTIGKPEIVLCVMLLLWVNMMLNLILNKKNRRVYYVALFFVSLSTYMCKETSVILIPISVLILMNYCLFNREERTCAIGILCETVSAFLVYVIIKKIVNSHGVISIPYTSYTFTLVNVVSNFVFYFKYCWDVFIIGIVAFAGNGYLFLKDKKSKEKAACLILSITGWGYLLGICLWQIQVVYYIYPVIIFFGISITMVLVEICKKYILLIVGIATIYGGWNGIIISGQTIDTSSIFSESMNYLLYDDRIKDKIFVPNYTIFEEPPYQMNLLLQLFNKDLKIYGTKNLNELVDPKTLELYGYSLNDYEILKNQVEFQEGSYILCYNFVRDTWVPSRVVNPIYDVIDVDRIFGAYEVQRLAGREITKRRFTYMGVKDELCGWEIYQIMKKKPVAVITDWVDWFGVDNTELIVYDTNYNYVVFEGLYDIEVEGLDVICKIGDKIIPSKCMFDRAMNTYRVIIDITQIEENDVHIDIMFSNYFIPSKDIENSSDNRELTLRYPEQIVVTNSIDSLTNLEE